MKITTTPETPDNHFAISFKILHTTKLAGNFCKPIKAVEPLDMLIFVPDEYRANEEYGYHIAFKNGAFEKSQSFSSEVLMSFPDHAAAFEVSNGLLEEYNGQWIV